jgi:hypothetical protein
MHLDTLLDHLQRIDRVEVIRVEDAPASRSEADYSFISNEIFVVFASKWHREAARRFGFLPTTRSPMIKSMTMADLEAALAAIRHIGAPDYSDESMLQYLRTERIVPPYQTRGYKLVELVRVYEAGVTRPNS